MPKQTYKIQQFHGGLNSDSDPRDLIEGQSPTLVDCGIDSVGRLKLMGATTEVDGSEEPKIGEITSKKTLMLSINFLIKIKGISLLEMFGLAGSGRTH